jgi:bifunctional non-homologous end joining protein LigD
VPILISAKGTEDAAINSRSIIEPMLLKTGTPPPDDGAFAFEFKWDGMRAIFSVEHGRVHVQSRNGRDFTAHYPELHALAESTGRKRIVLDGEIIAPDELGRPSFDLLSSRIRRAPKLGIQCGPTICFMVFDVLRVGVRDLTRSTYLERRRVLDDLELNGAHWKTPANFIGSGERIRDVSR